jgi:hypothetical protein
MTVNEIVRVWKDVEFREGAEGTSHPAGEITLDHGGTDDPFGTFTVFCCTVDAFWCPQTGMPLCPQSAWDYCPPHI